jgi:hypothetical protein
MYISDENTLFFSLTHSHGHARKQKHISPLQLLIRRSQISLLDTERDTHTNRYIDGNGCRAGVWIGILCLHRVCVGSGDRSYDTLAIMRNFQRKISNKSGRKYPCSIIAKVIQCKTLALRNSASTLCDLFSVRSDRKLEERARFEVILRLHYVLEE